MIIPSNTGSKTLPHIQPKFESSTIFVLESGIYHYIPHSIPKTSNFFFPAIEDNHKMQKAIDLVRKEVLAIAPYNAGVTISEVIERFAPPVIAKLGSNENPIGPSPSVNEAICLNNDLMRLYPDPRGRLVRMAIGQHFSIDSNNVIVGNGSEDLLSIIARAILRPDDQVVTFYPSFPLHEDYATLMGAKIERILLDDTFTVDIESLLRALSNRPRMLIFSNPMNPVGVTLRSVDLERIIQATPAETLIVIDEAYGEYIKGDDYKSALEILPNYNRSWIVLKTFSKAYGLAGLRLGYGIAADAQLISLLDRVRTPFNVNSVVQAAARAALADHGHLQQVINLAHTECARVNDFLQFRGFRTAPTNANFIFFNCRRNATEVFEQLLCHGVIVKPWKQIGYETYIRVSAGTRPENDQFMTALSEVMCEKL